MSGIRVHAKGAVYEPAAYFWRAHPNVIPNELLAHVFSFLPVGDQLRCREICQDWRRVIDDMPHLWLSLAERVMKTSYRSPSFDSMRNFQALYQIRENELQGRFVQYEDLGDRSFYIDSNGCKYLAVLRSIDSTSRVIIVNLQKNLVQSAFNVTLTKNAEGGFISTILSEGILCDYQGDECEIVDFRNPLSIQRYKLSCFAVDQQLIDCLGDLLIFDAPFDGTNRIKLFWDSKRKVWIHPYDRVNPLRNYFPVDESRAIKVYSHEIAVIDIANEEELQTVALPELYINSARLSNGDVVVEVSNDETTRKFFRFEIGNSELERIILPSPCKMCPFHTGWVTYNDEEENRARRPFSKCELKVFNLLNRDSPQVVNFPLNDAPTEGPSGIETETLFSNAYLEEMFIGDSIHEILISLETGGTWIYLIWNYDDNNYKISEITTKKKVSPEKKCHPYEEYPIDYTLLGSDVATLFECIADDFEKSGKTIQALSYTALSQKWKSFYLSPLMKAILSKPWGIIPQIKVQALRIAAEKIRDNYTEVSDSLK